MSLEDDDEYYTSCFQANLMLGEVYVTFAKSPSAEAKFLYTYDILKKHNKLPTKLLIIIKNNLESRVIRERANKKFKNKDYVSAFCEYNKSVMTAKIDSQDYALALANRSAALFYLEEYDNCICDIQRALASKYPKELTYKLYEREVKCLIKMNKTSQAKLKLEEFLTLINQTKLPKDQVKTIITQIKMLLQESSSEENTNVINYNIIKLLGGSNKNIPALSKFVQLKYSESMGRCLIVSTDVSPGDVLAIEKPYAGILNPESLEHNCRYCFKRCLSGIPCLTCTLVIYCDEHCRDKSFKYGHKYECSLLTTFVNWPSMGHMEHLSLFIFLTAVSKFGLEKYIATVRALNIDDTDPVMRGFNNNGKYLSDQFCSAYTLEGNETKRTVSDLFMRHCYAAVLVSFVRLVGLEIPDDQLGIVGESLVHIICAVASNAHGIAQYPERKTWTLNNLDIFMPVASLLLPVLSLLNHHCDPNVIRHNYNGTVVLRALQPIPKNSQLFDNYGKLYATHSKRERQVLLNSQYCFWCNCKACEENWPLYTDLLDQSNKECTTFTHISLDLLKGQSNLLYEIIKKMKNENFDGLEHLQFLYSHLDLLHKNVKKPWVEYCDCQETIKQILYVTADKFAIEFN